MSALSVTLHGPDDTRRLGAALAGAVGRLNPGALLLYGQLGAGKTLLASALGGHLPGGDRAEFSSPSFTICNIYYTSPLVHHFDLYRLAPGLANDDLAESLDNAAVLTIVEWPEHMAKADAPADGLACRLSLPPGEDPAVRRAQFTALGPLGSRFLELLEQALSQKSGA